MIAATLVTLVPFVAATAAQHRHHHGKVSQGSTHAHHSGPPKHHRHKLADHVHTDWWHDRRVHSVVHVVRIDPGAPIRFRVVPASAQLAEGRLRTTSSMCHRVHCLVAVNGSFRDIPSRLPRGGEVVDRVPVRLRGQEPSQAILGNRHSVHAGRLHTRIAVTTGSSSDSSKLHITGVNVLPGAGHLSLYTWHYGARTPAGHHLLAVRATLPRHARFRLGHNFHATLAHPSNHRVGVHAHSVVLVARGKARGRLTRLARSVHGDTVRIAARPHRSVPESLSTSYRLLRDSHVVAPRDHRPFVTGHNPRTILAWTKKGRVWLITIDGRSKHSRGATLVQAALVAKRLGATQAANLDGGGSTTFVVHGHVKNHPSDGRQRGVVNALAIVPSAHPYDPGQAHHHHAKSHASKPPAKKGPPPRKLLRWPPL